MQILTPIPKRLSITQGMFEDFLLDPVLALKVICGYDLDLFQRVALKLLWWFPNCLDSSGLSTGKTVRDFGFAALRSILIPDHRTGVYYPTGDSGRNNFWGYFDSCPGKIFRAYLGTTERKDDDGQTRGSSSYKAKFRNGNELIMPAPGWMKDSSPTQAGLRFNTLIVDEWTHIDAASSGLDEQIIGRSSRPCWNQHHPIWCNHRVLTATAKTKMHPAVIRYQAQVKAMEGGDPSVMVFSFNFKDASDRLGAPNGKTWKEFLRDEGMLKQLRATPRGRDRAFWLGEALGFWASSGAGWFTEEELLACLAGGKARGLEPEVAK